jgi:hypothetical protein
MATWDFVKALNFQQTASQLPVIQTDGTLIYMVDLSIGDEGVWVYDPVAQTETNTWPLADFPTTHHDWDAEVSKAAGLAMFKGKPYVMLQKTTSPKGSYELEIFRLDSEGAVSVHQHDISDFPSGMAAVRGAKLWATNDIMVGIVTGISGDTEALTLKTTDGTTWSINVTTYDLDGGAAPNGENWVQWGRYGDFRDLGIYEAFGVGGSGQGIWFYNEATDNWDLIDANRWGGGVDFDRLWYANITALAEEFFFTDEEAQHYTPDFTTYTDTGQAAIFRGFVTLNMPNPLAHDGISTNVYDFIDGTTEWSNVDDIEFGLDGGGQSFAIRMNSGKGIIIGRGGGNSYSVYERDTDYTATPNAWQPQAASTFYHSVGLPLLPKSFHPFTTVKPGNMGVNLDETTVYLGTNTSGDTQKIAKSDEKNSRDYGDWTPMTDEFTDTDVDGLEAI